MNVLLIIGLLLAALFVVFVLFSIALAVLGVTVTTISAAWHAGKPDERKRGVSRSGMAMSMRSGEWGVGVRWVSSGRR